MADLIIDVLLDMLRVLPFLFVTYLLMEYLEHNALGKFAAAIRKVGRFGPLIGAALGVVPQCGFSALAAGFYAGGVITEGTLISIFLSTSDEMLPLLISEGAPVPTMIAILAAKLAIGAITGFIVDWVLSLTVKKREKHIHDFCEDEHCRCEEGIFVSALRHTLKIWVFVVIVSLLLEILLEVVGFDSISNVFGAGSVWAVLLSALIGLIPNCGASIVITQCYLAGILSTGAMMAGLLVGAGVGLLILYRSNRNLKENLRITMILYASGVAWGLLINAFFPY